MIRKDCFAYRVKNGKDTCQALIKLYCQKENCKFYKNKEQFDRELREEKLL